MTTDMTIKKIAGLINTVKEMKEIYQTGNFFHCSIAMRGGNIIAMAYNDYSKSHPYHIFGEYKPTKIAFTTKYKPCTHSEIKLLKRLISMRRDDFHKITVINIRINNNNQLACAAPCPNCLKRLIEYGFKKIFFTTDKANALGEIKIKTNKYNEKDYKRKFI